MTFFWTERDSLGDDATSSRDPLGTETFARIRYVTLICLWLDIIEQLKAKNFSEKFELIKKCEKLTANVDLYTVSKLLGHKDIKMSQRYAHHCPESLRGGVEVLDKISTIK